MSEMVATCRLPATIAIDGPAGAGKSTVGALLAERLGYAYFDSGVLYRAVTLAAPRRGVAFEDEADLAAIAATLNLAFLPPAIADGRQMTVLLDGEDVTWALRSAAVNAAVSTVSAWPAVRRALLERQRAIGRQGRVVMVGRDIGTTVLPEADLKIFLTASPEERARRRHIEQLGRGQESEIGAVLMGVLERDRIDTHRAASPLTPAADAIIIPSDGINVGAVVDLIAAHACQRVG